MNAIFRAALGRLALLPATLVAVSLLTFALVELAPGDPASVRGGLGASPSMVAETRALLGLDRPPVARYLGWLSRSARLDFGASLVDGRPVRERIAEALPRTAAIGLLALVLALATALPLGLLGAAWEGRRFARALETVLALAYGVPVVAIALGLLRAGAPYGRGLVAPALCLAWPAAIVLARHQRSALSAVLHADYLVTARAKGLSSSRVLATHALKNALLPMVTLAGHQVPALLSGSVLVERIFGVPGIGLLGYDAVLARDAPTVMALTTLAALLSALAVAAADAAYLFLDPRLRDAHESVTR